MNASQGVLRPVANLATNRTNTEGRSVGCNGFRYHLSHLANRASGLGTKAPRVYCPVAAGLGRGG